MVATPWLAAFFSTAAPVWSSRLTIIRTFAPLVIIWSAMVWNAVLSPWAFWMSYWTPAALNAAVSAGRSAVSQRAEDLLSGRITPIFAFLAFALLLDELLLELPQAVTLIRMAAVAAVRPRIPLRIEKGPFWSSRRAWRPLGVGIPVGGTWSPSARWLRGDRFAAFAQFECCVR